MAQCPLSNDSKLQIFQKFELEWLNNPVETLRIHIP